MREGIYSLLPCSGLLQCFCANKLQQAYLATSSFVHRPLANKYYHTENDDENPFICSQQKDNGMRVCSSVPKLFEEGGVQCNLDMYSNVTDNTTCINWNQYYNNCSDGMVNPFKGAINFDNIFYAWIAIFQVTRHLFAWAGSSPGHGFRGPNGHSVLRSAHHTSLADKDKACFTIRCFQRGALITPVVAVPE